MAGNIFYHSFHFPHSFLSIKPVHLYDSSHLSFCGCNFDLKFQSYHSILRDTKAINYLLAWYPITRFLYISVYSTISRTKKFYFGSVLVTNNSEVYTIGFGICLPSQLQYFTSLLPLYHVLRRLRYSFFIIREPFFFRSFATLEWAHNVAEYILWTRMIYLTDFCGLDSTVAAAIVNVCTGVETIMPIGMAFLVDVFTGHHRMFVCSSFMYSYVSFQIFPHAFVGDKSEDLLII